MPNVMTTAQKALRLLAVLIAGCERFPEPRNSNEVAVFKGEVRLNALMFWLRNPDYLAWEILNLYDSSGALALLEQAQAIIDSEEPVLRRDAMAKWRFGAYEPIDDEMAILSSRLLVRTVMRPAGPKSAGNDFLILADGWDLVQNLGENHAYRWYAERMQWVLCVANEEPGSTLKDRQYKQFEYASTRGHELIPPITHRVIERLNVLLSGAT